MFSKLKQRAAIALKSASQITINDRQFVGSNISVVGNEVMVDGIRVDIGNLESLSPIVVTVDGDADSVYTQSGDVSVSGNVSGDIRTQSGTVQVDGTAHGDVNTMSGDVTVHGSIQRVKTMSGDVTTYPSNPKPPARRPDANYW